VHARDIAAAFLTALEAPIDKIHCAAFNVGTESNNLTVAEIAQSVVDVVPGAKLLITGETGADPRSYRVDFSAFRNALGFRAAWSVPDGAAELYKAYISAGLTDQDFTRRFTRLAHLETLRDTGVLDASMRRVTADE
jgi:nucleoside-diphosphate-sugar epimerase